jgi:hypothetical protein
MRRLRRNYHTVIYPAPSVAVPMHSLNTPERRHLQIRELGWCLLDVGSSDTHIPYARCLRGC